MQLNQIQNHLERLYEVSVGPRVEDYLMSEQQMLQTVAAAGTPRVIPEQLFVQQDGDDLALSLYLDAAIVERLQTSDPQDPIAAENLVDFCTALEGVSHFLYVVWKTGQQRRVTLLELEIQAEVDKFITLAKVLGRQQGSLPSGLRQWLFDSVSFDPALDGPSLLRYQDANRYAARFCSQLEQLIHSAGGARLLREARRFYRLGQQDKLQHIAAG